MTHRSSKPTRHEADTVVNPHTNAVECRRCGAVMPFILPMPVSVWVAMVKAFNKIHELCEDKRDEKEQTEQH